MTTFGLMNAVKNWLFLFTFCCMYIVSCNKEDDEMPEGRYGYVSNANVTIVLDSNEERLDGNANPSVIPSGHGAQSPVSETLKIESIGFLTGESESGGNSLQNNYSVISVDINGSSGNVSGDFRHGSANFTAKYLRLTLSYEKFTIESKLHGNVENLHFLAFMKQYYNPYESILLGNDTINMDSVLNQGKWFLVLDNQGVDSLIDGTTTSITEPNVLHSQLPNTSDNSCTIICPIDPPITFYKGEPRNLQIKISCNHSFEWIEHSDPAFFEPLDGDTIYDFGLRGAKVTW
jgi:hypothetical protein